MLRALGQLLVRGAVSLGIVAVTARALSVEAVSGEWLKETNDFIAEAESAFRSIRDRMKPPGGPVPQPPTLANRASGGGASHKQSICFGQRFDPHVRAPT